VYCIGRKHGLEHLTHVMSARPENARYTKFLKLLNKKGFYNSGL
jgi:hypothetical protein